VIIFFTCVGRAGSDVLVVGMTGLGQLGSPSMNANLAGTSVPSRPVLSFKTPTSLSQCGFEPSGGLPARGQG
jgi:hypothetical protein